MYKNLVLIAMILAAMVALLACSDSTTNTHTNEESEGSTVEPAVSEEVSKSSSDEVNKIRTVEDAASLLYPGITREKIQQLTDNPGTPPSETLATINGWSWELDNGYLEIFFDLIDNEARAYKVIVRRGIIEEVLFDTSSSK